MPKLITKRETKLITLKLSILVPWLMVVLLSLYILWLSFAPKLIKTPNSCPQPILESLGTLPLIPQASLITPSIPLIPSLPPKTADVMQPSPSAEALKPTFKANSASIDKSTEDFKPAPLKKLSSTLPSINQHKTNKPTAKTSHFIPKANQLLPDATTRQPAVRASQVKANVKSNAATSTASPAAQPHDFQIMEESLGISLGP